MRSGGVYKRDTVCFKTSFVSYSEREVNRAWPELKDKMKIWKQSQSRFAKSSVTYKDGQYL